MAHHRSYKAKVRRCGDKKRVCVREGSCVGYSAGREDYSRALKESRHTSIGGNRFGFGYGMCKDGGNSEKDSKQGLHSQTPIRILEEGRREEVKGRERCSVWRVEWLDGSLLSVKGHGEPKLARIHMNKRTRHTPGLGRDRRVWI